MMHDKMNNKTVDENTIKTSEPETDDLDDMDDLDADLLLSLKKEDADKISYFKSPYLS